MTLGLPSGRWAARRSYKIAAPYTVVLESEGGKKINGRGHTAGILAPKIEKAQRIANARVLSTPSGNPEMMMLEEVYAPLVEEIGGSTVEEIGEESAVELEWQQLKVMDQQVVVTSAALASRAVHAACMALNARLDRNDLTPLQHLSPAGSWLDAVFDEMKANDARHIASRPKAKRMLYSATDSSSSIMISSTLSTGDALLLDVPTRSNHLPSIRATKRRCSWKVDDLDRALKTCNLRALHAAGATAAASKPCTTLAAWCPPVNLSDFAAIPPRLARHAKQASRRGSKHRLQRRPLSGDLSALDEIFANLVVVAP